MSDNTLAERLLFSLQMMGVMSMSGRQDEADQLYIKAQKLAQELIDGVS